MVAVDTDAPGRCAPARAAARTAQVLSLSAGIPADLRFGDPRRAGERRRKRRSGRLGHPPRSSRAAAPLGRAAAAAAAAAVAARDRVAAPAGALLEFARRNNVDLIVLGAPSPAQHALAWWRSVASGVTANAHCSVYVVRIPEPEATSDQRCDFTLNRTRWQAEKKARVTAGLWRSSARRACLRAACCGCKSGCPGPWSRTGRTSR